ncbi:transporter substrate-binding protein [Paraburkholderia rhizosphaerae]|uniref:Amino acid/amide ABC transporter substrate-binding protein (HAAT family) n=1 Tax=Paraburkholderia rhizosphaerae TaxID=480658 RepID=A0A4R8LSM3_9BURK|nr:transporter substrate-binding protein [Paraburkholderia rhizosphaerae]TDY49765.1 amino acid/amide ABC transporter substrate-binding protein (HAAT family) [Paraburkholderia rhizosphaerae]
MKREDVPIGLLWSTHGTYERLGRSSLAGASHAIDRINRLGLYGFQLRAIHYDPHGEAERYRDGAARLLGGGARHIFGATTSASRKDIAPDLQQHHALLWYSCSYEGFESDENVVYLGATPNQALLPLLRHALDAFGKTAFLIGSDYVWGWESNRITREVLQFAGGEVLGEHYLDLGATEGIDNLVDELLASAPAFVLNNLVGESSYSFLKALDRASARAGQRLPVLSYDLTEAELDKIGPLQALRLITAGPYFEELVPEFTRRQYHEYGQVRLSHFYTGAHVSIELFAQARAECGTDDPAQLLAYLHQTPVITSIGTIRLCSHNNHGALPCHIAELAGDRFRIVHSEPRAVEADPYLTQTDLRTFQNHTGDAASRHLRIVK